jgi:type VI secretion system protein ImpK
MTPDDPYFGEESERTVVKPVPGGRRANKTSTGRRTTNSIDTAERYASAAVPSFGQGINYLVDAAGTLLSLVGKLRGTTSNPDIDTLRLQVEQEVNTFERKARLGGADDKVVSTARYVLCALIDETVLATLWGNESMWIEHTLLAKFHREAWGGETFFNILNFLLEKPKNHLELLELMYLCLAMGFEGKYKVKGQGSGDIQSIQENLYNTIRNYRQEFERELSPHWQGVQDQRHPLVRYVPLWVLGAVLGLMLMMIFIGFRVSLTNTTDPIFQQLNAIGNEPTPLAQVTYVATPEPIITVPEAVKMPTLTELLAQEIDAGQLTISENPEKTNLIIQGDGLFRSGSVTIEKKHTPLFKRIGQALKEVSGRILVVGHTDNVPIRSLRFSSNWDLSRQRAASVAQLLGNVIGTRERIFAEGRADTEPLVPNDTVANRARNRRVEIIVYKGTRNP